MGRSSRARWRPSTTRVRMRSQGHRPAETVEKFPVGPTAFPTSALPLTACIPIRPQRVPTEDLESLRSAGPMSPRWTTLRAGWGSTPWNYVLRILCAKGMSSSPAIGWFQWVSRTASSRWLKRSAGRATPSRRHGPPRGRFAARGSQ